MALTIVGSARWGATLVGFGVIAAAVVSLDHLFLAVHCTSDVVAGMLLAVVVVLSSWLAVKKVPVPARRIESKATTAPHQGSTVVRVARNREPGQ